MLHVGQLHELTLPVPHLLCDHLAQPHRILIHLQPGGLGTCAGRGERGGGGEGGRGERGGGRGEGGRGGREFTEKLFQVQLSDYTRDYLQ